MGYVGIDISGARWLGQILASTSAGAGQVWQQVLGALTVAELDSAVPGLVARVQGGLAELGQTIIGRAAAADRMTVGPAEMLDMPRPFTQPLAGATLFAGTTDGQTFDSGPPATVLGQNSFPDSLAFATRSATSGSMAPEPTMRLPATSAEGADFLAEIRARLDRAPNEPIRFEDGGVSVTILKNPEGFPVVRQSGQKLTESAADLDTPAYEVVIDGQLAEAKPDTTANWLWMLGRREFGPMDPNDVEAQGIIVDGGHQIAGSSSEKTFYLALDTPDPANPGAPSTGWRIGAGDPPPNAHLAFGGGIPMIIGGLPYGVTNVYEPGAPADLPIKGPPGPGNDQFLTQRSNAGFGKQEGRGPTVGKAVTGLGPDGIVVILVQQHGTSGPLLSGLRDMLARMGVRDAVSWDGSDSAMLMEDTHIVVEPARGKDNSTPAGLGFRLPLSEQGPINWAADHVPGTSLSFTPLPYEALGIWEGDVWQGDASYSYYGGMPADSAPLPTFSDSDFDSIDVQQFDQMPTFTTADALPVYDDYDFADFDYGVYDTGIYDSGAYDFGPF